MKTKPKQHRNVYPIIFSAQSCIEVFGLEIDAIPEHAVKQQNVPEKKEKKRRNLKNQRTTTKLFKKRARKQTPRSQNKFWIVEFSHILFVRVKRIRNISSVHNNVIPQHRNHIKRKCFIANYKKW